MSYLALYRKFRPPVWEDVKGQDHIVTTLRNQLTGDRVGHAYLFQGTRGTGKTSVAKIFARAVNCADAKDGNPCGECASCKSAMQGINMNIIEIDAASNNRVEHARTLIEEVTYPPVGDPKKVYIIDEAHMLTKEAFNALLKTIEDPPEYVIFILATTEVQAIPVTILSRCQRYDFHRISAKVIAARLKEVADAEHIDIDKEAIGYIARAADGALRDGLSLLDQCTSFYADRRLTLDLVLEVLGAVDTGVFARFFDSLHEGDTIRAIDLLDEVVMQGKELSQFVSDFIWYLRNLMLAQTGDAARILDLSTESLKELQERAASSDQATVMRYLRIFSDVYAQMRYDLQKRTLLEMTVVRICHPSSDEGAASLEARVRALEEQENRLFHALKMIETGTIALPSAGNAPKEAAPRNTEETQAPKKAPVAVPDDVREVVAHWDEYIPSMSGQMKAYMQAYPNPKLSVSDDGKLVIAFFTQMHADAMKGEGMMRELTELIRSRTGKEMQILIEYVKDPATFQQSYPDLKELIHMDIEEEE